MAGEGGSVRAFLIADIRGFTRFTHDRGDEEAARVARRFGALTEDTVAPFAGELLELRGDEALVVFDSTRGAIRAAIELQGRYVADDETEALPVGIGIAAGEAVPVGEGYRGGALNLAARLCGFASAGEIIVSQELAHLAGALDQVSYEDRGLVELKNLPDPVHLLRVVPEKADPAEWFGGRGPRPSDARVRVAVADDSVLFREGVVRVLEDAGFEVTGTAGDADELMASIRADPPDVAIVDIRMPPTGTNEGLVAARSIREEFPTVGVLVLSQYVETRHAARLLEASPDGIGYVLKDRVADVEELAGAVRRIAGGGSVVDPEVVRQLLRRSRDSDPLERLTQREREVLALMAEGRSNQAIGERLFLSPRTVETHVGHIFTKLDLLPAERDNQRVLAVVAFLRGN
jgi:DNA-binding NarL/FixJ family response regulator/class 3 adenylate cyclase